MRQDSHGEIAAVHADRPAENLFFAQYRYFMAGYATGDVFAWDSAFDRLLHFVSQDSARALYGEFLLFARTLNAAAGHVPGFRPDVCRCLCRDEYFALALVCASQRGDEAGERQAAAALVGLERVPALVSASRGLAKALAARRFILAPIGEEQAETAPRLERHKIDRRHLH